ncbi:MAG: bile acid:sodium symporter family protein [Woeseiaceae bacterium]|nr:bile acid:sodium symporter family protein [Woeseiaceae bacterium]
MDASGLDKLQIMLDPVGQTGVALALMLMMFSIALGLRISDFRLLVVRPLVFVTGVLTQVVGLPLLTFLVISGLDVLPSIALGMIVVACCPGGVSSNLLTYLGHGNVAFSVSLTATSSVFAAVLTPASILFWSRAYQPTSELLDTLDVDPLAFVIQTMLLLGVPLIVGMLIAARAPYIAAGLRRFTGPTGVAVLASVIIYGTVYFYPVLIHALPYLFVVAVLHNTAAFALGGTVGLLLRAPGDVRRALMFEVGIQNSGLALVILVGQLQGLGGAAAIAAVWGIWHLVAGSIIVGVLRFLDKR